MSGCFSTLGEANTNLCIGCHEMVRNCKCLWENYRELSEIVSNLSMNIDKLLSSNKRQPFKCPVCNGTKLIQSKVETKILRFDSCVACEGKGIVWG
jgi:hypothetical protein